MIFFIQDQDANEKDLDSRPRGGQVGQGLEDGFDKVAGHGQEALRRDREIGHSTSSCHNNGRKSAVLRLVGDFCLQNKYSLFGINIIDTLASSSPVCSAGLPERSIHTWPCIWI